MSNRPQWTKAIQRYLGDMILDDPSYAQEGSDDALLSSIEEAVNALLCQHYGHEIEDDQCMIPDHRYCVWCQQRATTLGIQVTNPEAAIVAVSSDFPEGTTVLWNGVQATIERPHASQ